MSNFVPFFLIFIILNSVSSSKVVNSDHQTDVVKVMQLGKQGLDLLFYCGCLTGFELKSGLE